MDLQLEPTWGNVLGVCMLAALCVPCCVRRLCMPGWLVPHRTPIGFCTLHACCYRLCYCCACCRSTGGSKPRSPSASDCRMGRPGGTQTGSCG